MMDQVFLSCSREDMTWLQRLRVHLAPRIRQGRLEVWDDTQLRAGDNFRRAIDLALQRARVVVLFVSPDFLASDLIAQHQLPQLLATAAQGGVRVLWIPIRDSCYQETEIASYYPLHAPERPLAALTAAEVDRALENISQQIVAAFEYRFGPPPPPLDSSLFPRFFAQSPTPHSPPSQSAPPAASSSGAVYCFETDAAPIALLHVLTGTHRGRCYVLTEEHRQVTVGREGAGRGADIELPSGAVGSLHCMLRIAPRSAGDHINPFEISLVDLTSPNGTYVNQERVQPQVPRELQHLDQIRIGGVQIVVHRC
jgi:hypothetical protein